MTFIQIGNKGCKDGPVSEALIEQPLAILIDSGNNLIVSDRVYIRKIDLLSQQVQTIAGGGDEDNEGR